MGFGVWGLGFGVYGLGFRIWGLGFTVWGLGLGVWRGLGSCEVWGEALGFLGVGGFGSFGFGGFGVQGLWGSYIGFWSLGFRAWGLGLRGLWASGRQCGLQAFMGLGPEFWSSEPRVRVLAAGEDAGGQGIARVQGLQGWGVKGAQGNRQKREKAAPLNPKP